MKSKSLKLIATSLLLLSGAAFADQVVAPPQTVICDSSLPDPQKCKTPDGQELKYLVIQRSLPEGKGTYTFSSGLENEGMGAFDDSQVDYTYTSAQGKILLTTAGFGMHSALGIAGQAWQQPYPRYKYYTCKPPATAEQCAFTNIPFKHPSTN